MYLFKLKFLFSSGIHPGVGLLGHMNSSIFSLRNSTLFSTVAAPIYIPTKCKKIPLFFTTSPFVICVLFDDSHSDIDDILLCFFLIDV